MKVRAKALWVLLVVGVLLSVFATLLLRRGFRASDEPSSVEKVLARAVRNLAIPSAARRATNPLTLTAENLQESRELFANECAICHGEDGSGESEYGQNLYPRAPDLRAAATQELTDGELHYIIQNGVQLTGMPARGNPHEVREEEGWKLVLFLRHIALLNPQQVAEQKRVVGTARYTGSQACQECHEEIYARWKKTPMANVVRDPREHPDAILPDLATNPYAKFAKEDVAFVYGSIWKQRYFTQVGDDYFPLGAQWDVMNKMWRPYFVAAGTDWWTAFYPPDNRQRPTGPTCDGCHSVGYDIRTKQVVEWNVGCERCHGPGSEHLDQPTRTDILNPARMDYVRANDICIQCHSQGQPLANPMEGRYYDWPVGYDVGEDLKDYWRLEEHELGETSFTHFADGTSHKNRMQGNDYVQSVMYQRGVTCFDCHDTHGTEHSAQLLKPANEICLNCHGPGLRNGPREGTIEQHTHHEKGSTGSECIACHMPKIAVTIGDVNVRSHTFRFVTPAMTDRYQIPNPCTSCHTHADKDTAWATEEMRRWPGQSPWRLE